MIANLRLTDTWNKMVANFCSTSTKHLQPTMPVHPKPIDETCESGDVLEHSGFVMRVICNKLEAISVDTHAQNNRSARVFLRRPASTLISHPCAPCYLYALLSPPLSVWRVAPYLVPMVPLDRPPPCSLEPLPPASVPEHPIFLQTQLLKVSSYLLDFGACLVPLPIWPSHG